jgi:CubicO group peptidase (beta-lactamase class C family)
MKKVLIGISVVIIAFITVFYIFIYPKFVILSGIAAKNMCSCVFVADIDEQTVLEEDLNFDLIPLTSIEVDYENKSVTANVFGFQTKTAYFLGPTGCTLVNNIDITEAYHYDSNWKLPKYDSLAYWFDYVDTIEYLSDEQLKMVSDAIALAFKEINPDEPKKNTRAALVIHKGQLVAEQYAEGFDKNSRLLGWSMTKSLISTMVGLLVDDGKIVIDEPVNIPQWQSDDRSKITWRNLLHMNSGLRWEEKYDDISDAVIMLYDSDNIFDYAITIPIEFEPGTYWEYSSGTTNIIAGLNRQFFDTKEEYLRYLYERLFYQIGAYSLLIETDASGKFIGSSYSWATGRDWAKIGQFYLQNGNWAGEQLLDSSWVNFVQQPAQNSNNEYGGQFWINKSKVLPDLPEDTYYMDGFHGQHVFIIPSKDLVVVRLGLTYDEQDFDFNQWVAEIIRAIE